MNTIEGGSGPADWVRGYLEASGDESRETRANIHMDRITRQYLPEEEAAFERKKDAVQSLIRPELNAIAKLEEIKSTTTDQAGRDKINADIKVQEQKKEDKIEGRGPKTWHSLKLRRRINKAERKINALKQVTQWGQFSTSHTAQQSAYGMMMADEVDLLEQRMREEGDPKNIAKGSGVTTTNRNPMSRYLYMARKGLLDTIN